jgi:ubiquinone/menaquinone biosynthesis C-methylase UbiE
VSGSDPARQLAQEYSAKADAYERHWAPVIGPMAEPLLDALPLTYAQWMVDIGAGTGWHLDALAQRAQRGRVLAIDRAAGMLGLARSRTRGLAAVMDAERVALRSSVFSIATMIFVLQHLPDAVAALREAARILRPGGTVGIAAWGRSDRVDLPVWTEELDACGAAPDPRDPSLTQVSRTDTPEKLRALIALAGFAEPRAWTKTFEHRWAIDSVMAVQETCGMAARRLASLDAPVRAACESRVRERLAQMDLLDQSEVVFAVAVRR